MKEVCDEQERGNREVAGKFRCTGRQTAKNQEQNTKARGEKDIKTTKKRELARKGTLG